MNNNTSENQIQASVVDSDELTFSKSAGFIERLAAKAAAIACSIVIGVGDGDEIELPGWRLKEVGGIPSQIGGL